MVTLLIHIPPSSEDIDANGRDNRDITEESISQAQIMYDILNSSYKKGLKYKFYGQRYFSFEIIGSKSMVYFYASVPISLLDLVRQAVISSYPSAILEEVEDHNIFNKIGKINSTVGGELNLKKHYAFPIATYQESKRDGIQSLLNSFSNLTEEDGIGVQILIRPVDSSWHKEVTFQADEKRKGKNAKGGVNALSEWAKHLAVSFYKVPDANKEKELSSKKDLSSLEQSIVDAMEDKTRHAGFEINIKLVASSNINQRAKTLLNNVIASFSVYESHGKNGFEYKEADNMQDFVTSFILRAFKTRRKRNILNSTELSTLFHFPDQRNTPTSQLSRQSSKQVDGPRNIPDQGLLLGYNIFRGIKKPIRINQDDRRRHIYMLGQTGTGKTTLLKNLALQDMLNGNGFAFIDPHGDIADGILSMVPKERAEDVIYFNPSDMNNPLGLNMFEFTDPQKKDFLIQEAINMLYKLYDPNKQGMIGARFEHIFRNAALLVMSDPEGGTFIDIPKLFTDPKFVQEKLKYVTDQSVIDFWTKEMPQGQKSNDFGDLISWFSSKFGAFLSNDMMRNIIGQTKSAFNLREIMDNKKILIVNLSKGLTGELNSKLLGMIFVMKFQVAAMSRSDIAEEKDRVDFCLYVDEFQNFSTDSFAEVMSEARKFRFNLIVANQFTTQLTDEIRSAVFGNVGTIVAFRIGQDDTEPLKKYFQPTFDEDDLLKLATGDTIVRTLVNGVPTAPFSMTTLMDQGHSNPQLGEALKQLSSAKYGRPRAIVEEEIKNRLKSPEPAQMPGGGMSAGLGGLGEGMSVNSSMSSRAPQIKSTPKGSSFLDQWLSKKQGSANQTNSGLNQIPPQNLNINLAKNDANISKVINPTQNPLIKNETSPHVEGIVQPGVVSPTSMTLPNTNTIHTTSEDNNLLAQKSLENTSIVPTPPIAPTPATELHVDLSDATQNNSGALSISKD